jgi:hypothetical protein
MSSQQVQILIRFSTSSPDLVLPSSVTSKRTPILAIKRHIRQARIEFASRALRLILNGRVCEDDSFVGSIPGFVNQDGEHRQRELSGPPLNQDKGKGKAKDGFDSQPESEAQKAPTSERKTIYIHCAPGPLLTPAQLVAESSRLRSLISSSSASSDGVPSSQSRSTAQNPPQRLLGLSPPESSQPRGFDALMQTANLTPSEVAELRSMFTSLQLQRYTPETAPTPAELRLLEDAWLESVTAESTENTNMGNLLSGLSPSRQNDDATTAAGVPIGQYQDMLIGAMLGYFWPLGALVWLGFGVDGDDANSGMNQGRSSAMVTGLTSIWSKRRRMAVMIGASINLGIGLLSLMS